MLKTLFHQSIKYAPGSILPAAVNFLSIVIITRLLGPYNFGEYSLALGIAMFLTSIATQWIRQSIGRFLPSEADPEVISALKNAFILAVSLIVAFFLLMSALAFPVINSLGKPWKQYFFVVILFVMLSSLFDSLLVVYQSEFKIKQYALFNLCNALMKLVLGVCLIYYISNHGYMVILGSSIGLLAIVPLMWKNIGLKSPISFLNRNSYRQYAQYIKKYFSYGWPLTIWFLSQNMLNVGDRYIIQWYRGSSEVGLYSSHYSLMTGAIALLTVPLLLAAHPILIKSWGAGDGNETEKLLSNIIKWYTNIGILFVGTVCMFSGDISWFLLGKDYYHGHSVMPIIAAGYVLWQLAQYVHKPLEFFSKTRMMMMFIILTALFGVVLNVILVPTYGFIASAWITLASYMLYVIMVGIAGRSLIKWKLQWGEIMITLVSVLMAYGLIYIIRFIAEVKYGYWVGFITSSAMYVIFLSIYIYLNSMVYINRKRLLHEVDG